MWKSAHMTPVVSTLWASGAAISTVPSAGDLHHAIDELPLVAAAHDDAIIAGRNDQRGVARDGEVLVQAAADLVLDAPRGRRGDGLPGRDDLHPHGQRGAGALLGRDDVDAAGAGEGERGLADHGRGGGHGRLVAARGGDEADVSGGRVRGDEAGRRRRR